MTTPVQVNYEIKTVERCVSATFAFGQTSMNNPYFSIYFVVNNAGIIAVYDKSVPMQGYEPNEQGQVPFVDELKSNSMRLKEGTEKYDVLRFVHEELERIGEKLQREGRPLNDGDIGKLMTKIARKYEPSEDVQ